MNEADLLKNWLLKKIQNIKADQAHSAISKAQRQSKKQKRKNDKKIQVKSL